MEARSYIFHSMFIQFQSPKFSCGSVSLPQLTRRSNTEAKSTTDYSVLASTIATAGVAPFFLPSDGAELKPCTQSLAKVQLNFKMLWWTRNATRKSFKKSKSQLNQLFFKMEVAKHQVSFWKAKGCNTQDINSRFSRKNLSCYHSIHHVAHHVGSAPSAWYSDPGDLTTEVSCWR